MSKEPDIKSYPEGFEAQHILQDALAQIEGAEVQGFALSISYTDKDKEDRISSFTIGRKAICIGLTEMLKNDLLNEG